MLGVEAAEQHEPSDADLVQDEDEREHERCVAEGAARAERGQRNSEEERPERVAEAVDLDVDEGCAQQRPGCHGVDAEKARETRGGLCDHRIHPGVQRRSPVGVVQGEEQRPGNQRGEAEGPWGHRDSSPLAAA